MAKGITSDDKYGYKKEKGDCRYSPLDKVWEVVKCTKVDKNNEKALEASVLQQPTAVMIDASDKEFQSYKTGIFAGSKCSTSKPNHSLLLVGFDSIEVK